MGGIFRVNYTIIAFIAGVALGASLLTWHSRRTQRQRRRIPKHWPLHVRNLVNHREKQVWLWLSKVMFDQQILVKLPVTRCTTPDANSDAAAWYQLLNGVYCTFTLCNSEGQVIGCIDVPGPGGLSISNQTLKHTLLAHCSLHYWVVDPANLPHLIQIRTAFLGEHAARGGTTDSQLASRLRNVRDNLHATVDRQRQNKSAALANVAPRSNASVHAESELSNGWEQNSFVTPLDSRSAELGR